MPIQCAPCPVNTNTTVGTVAAFRDVETLKVPKLLETENDLCNDFFFGKQVLEQDFHG